MKEKKPQKQLLQLVMLALLSVVSVLVMANESFAAMDCASCHGDGIDPSPTCAGSVRICVRSTHRQVPRFRTATSRPVRSGVTTRSTWQQQ